MINFKGKKFFSLLLATAVFVSFSLASWAEESVGQERLAYIELRRVGSISKSGVTYNDYRDALVPAREYVGLLRDGSSATVGLLKKVMSYYEQALRIWALQSDSEFPVDSLRTDESSGADILRQCPDISRFHYKERDQIFVKDAVDCLWSKSSVLLEKALPVQH